MKPAAMAAALAMCLGLSLAGAWCADEQGIAVPSQERPKEWQAPVAQVPMLVEGEVVAVDAGARTFTVMTKPKHRLPPGKVVVGINSNTQMVKEELCLPAHLQVGDAVVVQGLRPPPLGVALFVQGRVTETAPLTVEPAREVRVVIGPGAEVSFLRQRELKLEDLSPGCEVQVIAWRGDEPVVAKEVHALFVLPGAARPGSEPAPEAGQPKGAPQTGQGLPAPE